jgi:N-acetylneuraminic acid mutarotase
VLKRIGLALVAMLFCVLALAALGCSGTTTTTTRGAGTTVSSTLTPAATADEAWSRMDPEGPSPAARSYHSMVLDPESGKVILFGGRNERADFNDTWAYDPATSTWSALDPTGEVPSARDSQAMVYDGSSGRVILFGGWDEERGVDLNDTWAYDPATNTWTELSPAGDLPAARDGHSLVFDPEGGQVTLFGGSDSRGQSLNDTWAYDSTSNTWNELSPSGDVPPPRAYHSMVYDSQEDKAILFGGLDGTGLYLNDTWAYDPAAGSWDMLDPAGDLPSKRSLHTMVYDVAGGRAILFGGATLNASFRETWAYNPADDSWTELNPGGDMPSTDRGHALVYEPARDVLILFGGWDTVAGKDLNDTWVYDLSLSTSKVSGLAGGPPPARSGQSMIYDSAGGRVVLFGGSAYYPEGEAKSSDFHDTWEYDPAVNAWTELVPKGDLPSARGGHSLVYDSHEHKVVLFGGATEHSRFGDTWAYDPAANAWIELDPDGELPSARDGHAMVYDPRDGIVILFGGWDGSTDLNDTWTYDLAANAWTELDPVGDIPAARSYHSLVYDSRHGQVILFGGAAEDWGFNDTWTYDLAANAWTELDPIGDLPSARGFSAMAYDSASGRALLFGGWDYESYLDVHDTWAYDLIASTWTELDPDGELPPGREGQSLVYDSRDRRVILFGGWGEDGVYLNDTWAYDPMRNSWTGLVPGTGTGNQVHHDLRPFSTADSEGSRP